MIILCKLRNRLPHMSVQRAVRTHTLIEISNRFRTVFSKFVFFFFLIYITSRTTVPTGDSLNSPFQNGLLVHEDDDISVVLVTIRCVKSKRKSRVAASLRFLEIRVKSDRNRRTRMEFLKRKKRVMAAVCVIFNMRIFILK